MERLNDLQVGESILIDSSKKTARTIWSNSITILHRTGNKQFTIRTNRENKEIRVWRLADIVIEEA